MRTLKRATLFIGSLLLVLFYNCNEDSASNNIEDGTSSISIKLVDNPGDYENVYIEVVDVMVKVNNDSENDNGWESIGANAGIYDLLELTGGLNVVLVDDFQVSSGMLNQIRLVLGENNSIVIDGDTFPLNTPSAQQSGLKIKVNQELESGFNYDFILDFNVDESIVIAGNSGNINLKPVINASAEFSSGKIQGAITPFDFQTMVSVQVGDDTISTFTNENGVFVLNGVPAGTYNVTITPDSESGYNEVVINDVIVVNGEITDIGTIALELMSITGAITGTITNESVLVTASVMVDGELITADTNETGMFLLENITTGIYTVTITPAEGSGLTAIDITDIEVLADVTADVGSITLE
jgi:hypothetical protein